MNPNLFVIGAPKSGTTSLASIFRQHPEILVSMPKETCFHFREYDKGVEYYKSTFFPGYAKQKIVCDMSILNMYYCEVTAPRIANDFPNAKLLAILRDPIQRAFSDYRESLNKGIENLKFEATLDAEPIRKLENKGPITQNMYFSRGLYFQQLQVFLKYFPRENLKVVLYEDFYRHPAESLNEIFDFIGVERRGDIDVSVSRNVNKSMVRSAMLQRFLRGEHKMAAVIKATVPKKWRNSLVELATKLKDINKKPYVKQEIAPQFRTRLTAYYEESNSNLERHFQLDLRSWAR